VRGTRRGGGGRVRPAIEVGRTAETWKLGKGGQKGTSQTNAENQSGTPVENKGGEPEGRPKSRDQKRGGQNSPYGDLKGEDSPPKTETKGLPSVRSIFRASYQLNGFHLGKALRTSPVRLVKLWGRGREAHSGDYLLQKEKGKKITSKEWHFQVKSEGDQNLHWHNMHQEKGLTPKGLRIPISKNLVHPRKERVDCSNQSPEDHRDGGTRATWEVYE